jgi:hypothetical protein
MIWTAADGPIIISCDGMCRTSVSPADAGAFIVVSPGKRNFALFASP